MDTEKLTEALSREWHSGTRVINCVVHMGTPLVNRPKDCELCLTDLRNQFNLALRVNEFLNKVVDDAREAVGIKVPA